MFNLFGKKPAKVDTNSIFVNLNAKHAPLSTTMVNLYAVPITAGVIVYFNNRMTYTVMDKAFKNLCENWGSISG